MENNSLFGDLDDFTIWKKEWQDMPEFIQDDENPIHTIEVHFMYKMANGLPEIRFGAYQVIKVHFETIEGIQEFANILNIKGINCETKSFCYVESIETFSKLLNQKITKDTKSIWYPKIDREKPSNFIYTGNKLQLPKYPIYIISKSRADTRLTSKALEEMQVPYHIVIEPQEYDIYSSVINKNKILILPFSNLGEGSIPARNWVWEHSISIEAKRHWILDDNINGFIRLNRNRKIKVDNGATFKAIEDFVDRYENVALAGMDYRYFALQTEKYSPYYLNTRIYSCILIDNNLKHRWRGKYNEDTDLSIRVLKDKYCTILFKAFLCNKIATLSMKGGNTDTIYNTGDNRKEFVDSLIEQHPDIVKKVWRYERWHHEVDYSVFKQNKLIRKKDLQIQEKVNNYNMMLKRVSI